jgi:hypothetical protein
VCANRAALYEIVDLSPSPMVGGDARTVEMPLAAGAHAEWEWDCAGAVSFSVLFAPAGDPGMERTWNAPSQVVSERARHEKEQPVCGEFFAMRSGSLILSWTGHFGRFSSQGEKRVRYRLSLGEGASTMGAAQRLLGEPQQAPSSPKSPSMRPHAILHVLD